MTATQTLPFLPSTAALHLALTQHMQQLALNTIMSDIIRIHKDA